jgi:hypothetical protein
MLHQQKKIIELSIFLNGEGCEANEELAIKIKYQGKNILLFWHRIFMLD